jgi:signal transduction histidine kinase
VLERARTERVDSLSEEPEADQSVIRELGARTGLFVPLVLGETAIGVLAAFDKRAVDGRFTGVDARIAEIFGARAAGAVDLSRRVEQDALRRAFEAQESERRRLALELHDETGQELTSILLGLRRVEEAGTDAERAEALASVRATVVQTLHEVRRLAVELRPKALDDFGLVPVSRIVEVHHEGLNESLVKQAMDAFYAIRNMQRLRKRPSTSELVDWIAMLKNMGLDNVKLDKSLPFLGTLLKKEQDLAAYADQVAGGARWRS